MPTVLFIAATPFTSRTAQLVLFGNAPHTGATNSGERHVGRLPLAGIALESAKREIDDLLK